MNVKSVTDWTLQNGARRRLRLFQAWRNMIDRCAGTKYSGNGFRAWQGLTVDWVSFNHFRAWSLANGYSKERCSLDRLDGALGYGPLNCEWVSVAENTRRQRARAAMLRRLSGGSIYGRFTNESHV